MIGMGYGSPYLEWLDSRTLNMETKLKVIDNAEENNIPLSLLMLAYHA
jgi:hypothetical protein